MLPRHGVDLETLHPPSMVPLKDRGPPFGDAKCLILNLRISLSLLPKLKHARLPVGRQGTFGHPVNGYRGALRLLEELEHLLLRRAVDAKVGDVGFPVQ